MMQHEFRNGRFHLPDQKGQASLVEIMKWQMSGDKQKWPHFVENKKYPFPPARVTGDKISTTWVGHSTVLIQTAGLNILTDPFFSDRASPFRFMGPKRVRNPGIAMADLPPIDVILLSHNHYDHLDQPALRTLAKNHSAKLITPLGNSRHVSGHDVVELDWRQNQKIYNINITLMPALHWSKRSLRDTNRSLWGAFVIEGPQGMIYFAADTGYGIGQHFREVHDTFGAPRLSLIPIGAYEPRWFMAPQHMNPKEAVQAHLDLKSQTSFAIHHGTVQLTDESIDAPVLALEEALAEKALTRHDFLVPDIGETLVIR